MTSKRSSLISRQRNAPAGTGLIQRARELKFEFVRAAGQSEEKANVIRVVASTNEPYDWGYYVETLVHEEKAVDRSAAFSALFNHNRNSLIGKIVSTKIENGKLYAEMEIDPDVEIMPKMGALKAIKAGYVKGVSIGYDYHEEDCEISYEQKEMTEPDGYKWTRNKKICTVNKWTLREISITPTPADLAAQVTRQLPESWTVAPQKTKGERIMNFNAWLRARGFDPSALSDAEKALLKRAFESERGTAKAAATAVADEGDEPEADNEVQAERAKNAKRSKELDRKEMLVEIRELAASHGVELSQEDLDGIKTKEQGLTLLLTRKAAAGIKANPQTPVAVDVLRDAADKADEAAEDGLLSLIPREFRGAHLKEKDLGMRTGSVLDIARRWMHAQGIRSVLDMGKHELAESMIGNGGRMNRHQRARMKKSGQRDAANVTSGMFTSFLLANVLDKAIYNGFMASDEAITYPLWTASRQVSDFKSFTGAALDVGNLVETTENVAFPELAKEEGGYSAQLGMWGATLSLTLQALVNDDLGEFMKWLGRAGFIARRTVDVKVYTDLIAATWTNRTTAGNLADALLSQLRASLSDIAGPAGQKLGMNARYLIVPSGLRSAALTITQIAPYIAPSDVKVNTDIIPIITPFLTTKATPANSVWYLAASQAFEPLIVATLAGMETPVVEEYDPGAVAARKWKIMLPFKVVIPTVSSNVQGMWRGEGT